MSVATRQTTRASGTKPRKAVWKKRFKIAFTVLFIVFGIVFVFGSMEAFKRLEKAKALVPDLDGVIQEMSNTPSEVLSADGVLLFSSQSEYRESVPIHEVPDLVKNAVLAAEDKRFYTHPGVDFWALGRIAYLALKDGEPSEGASTLTMQIAKQVYTDSSKTLDRKLDDMAMAVEIEKYYTKDEILQLYLNRSYFGAGAYGIVAAADVYFGKTLEELTISEAATLARCVRRPSVENPYNDYEKSIFNRDLVLRVMRNEGMITEQEFQDAKAEELVLREEKPQVITAKKVAPYFVDYVLKELRRKDIDIIRGGYTVYTTLDMGIQKVAEKEVRQAIKNNSKYRVNRMAFMATDARGRILTMVPDTDYTARQFNVMDSAPGRQPGSSFKPFVYAAGIELGAFDARSRISTAPFMIHRSGNSGAMRPVQGGVGSGGGSVGISSALASSNNTAAVQAQALVGTENVIHMAENVFGLKSVPLFHGDTLALGASEVLMTELVGAYSVFQSGGDRVEPYAIERIRLPDGKTVNMQPSIKRSVLSSETAETMDLFLRQAAYNGTGRASRAVKNARGKTGTTSENKDAWFCGYTDKLIAVCWMANIQNEGGRAVNKPMSSYIQGGTGAAPAWATIMKQIQAEIGEEGRSFRSAPAPYAPDPEDEELLDENLDGDGDGDDGTDDDTDSGSGFVVPPPLPGDPGYVPPGGGGTTGGGGDDGGSSDPPEDLVYVNVCADSGQRSTVYCPEAVPRPYVKGTEPKGKCPIHGP